MVELYIDGNITYKCKAIILLLENINAHLTLE